MAGVMSLMQPQQGPMPGQAPMQQMPGMMPQQGAATPAAMVGPLTQMHMQQLVQLMLNPRPDGPPLYAVISALAEKQKAAKAAQAAQGQQVMAQNQQMQQQPPVAAQIMQSAEQMPEPVMAAYGGLMQGYAGGGAVAFSKGGDPEEEKLRQQLRDMFGSAASPLNILGPRADQERQRAQDIIRMLPSMDKEQMRNILGQTQRMVDPAAYQEFGPGERMEQLAPPVNVPSGRGMSAESVTPQATRQAAPQPSATTFDIFSPSQADKLRAWANRPDTPENERQDILRRLASMEGQRPAPAGVASLARPQATLTPEEEQSFANRASTLRSRQGLPEDVLAGRQGIATLAAENLAAQRAEREQLAREAKEQRDAALARSQRGIMNDPMSLLALAGSIDTRRGQGVGSLARGAAGLLGKREEQAEAARKEFALAQRDQRMLQANERQANMLEMQRQQAIRENDFTRVSQIEDQLAALEVQKSQLLRSRQEHAEKMTLDERRVGAAELDAAGRAGRETALDLFLRDPNKAKEWLTMQAQAQAAGRPPQTGVDRQDLAELKTLQANLQKQVENILLPKPQRDAAATQLNQVNARIAQMAGLDGATAPTGGAIRPSSQAEFDALPKGARYINPADGKEYTKN